LKRFPKLTPRKLLIVAFMVIASSLQAADDRFESLGQKLICMCSCTQLLGACEMINCSSRPPLKKELLGLVNEGKDDKTILAHFAEKYGPKILSAPPTEGWFNISAWVMPFAAFAAGALVVIFAVKRRKSTEAGAEMAAPVDTSAYDREIEEELKKFNPED